jgi:hypothetical protein
MTSITLQIVKDKEIYGQNGIEAIDSVSLGSDLHDSCVSTELRLLLLCATGILAPFYYLLPSATFKFYLANDFHARQEKNRERKLDRSSFRKFLALFSTRENCGFREDMCAWAWMQWPGSYCDTDSGCCFPLAGSPGAQFGIHGLWPNYNDGGYPSKCGGDPFDPNVVKIADLMITLYRNSLLLSMDPVEILVQKITSSQDPGYRGFSRTDKES